MSEMGRENKQNDMAHSNSALNNVIQNINIQLVLSFPNLKKEFRSNH